MNDTAPIAMPTPKTIPASMRLESPSPKANMSPPTTMATRLKPLAIGLVRAACRTLTAFYHGEDCDKSAEGLSMRAQTTRQKTPGEDRRIGSWAGVTFIAQLLAFAPVSRDKSCARTLQCAKSDRKGRQ